MRLRRADPHTLAGAYALDALGEADRAAFERHLSGCDACRGEAASLREAAARLGTASFAVPPPRLRTEILSQAARTRQLPPAPAGPHHRLSLWHLRHWAAAPRLAIAAAGGCMLIALALGALTLHTLHRLHQEQRSSREIATILNAPDRTVMTSRAAGGGSATAVMSHADRALVLTTFRLPGLPPSERYEIWLMGPRGDRSCGMLPAPHGGMTPPVVVTGLAAGDRLGLTVEPSAGSRQPTSSPVVMLGLPS
jgi:anti-sigma-K factor RskA